MEGRIRHIFLKTGLVAITLPILPGAGLLTEKERMTLVILSLLLFVSFVLKNKRIINISLFLSVFISVFLTSQFISFKKVDIFSFQLIILVLLFIQNIRKEDLRSDNFLLGMICMSAVVILLQFLVNRIFLGFYLDFWMDIRRSFPVFLFCMIYFITSPRNSFFVDKTSFWMKYFLTIFIISIFLSYFNIGGKWIASRNVGYNLAFFYKDKKIWREMSSSFRRGLVYEYLGLWKKARNEFKKILISSPQDIDAHYHLAQGYQAEGLWYEAMLEYEKVLELNPRYCGSHYGLAMAYQSLGDTEKAEKEFLKEIEINPREIRAYHALEQFYERQGRIEKRDAIRQKRLEQITASIEKDIGDDNLKILPVVLNGGPVTVEIVARGTYAEGFWPRMEVWLSSNGRLIRGREVFVKSSTWKSYYFHFDTLPGEEKLIVHFTNDFFGGVENDRNLYIKRINFIYGSK